jgi:hypothetical protein
MKSDLRAISPETLQILYPLRSLFLIPSPPYSFAF